MMRPRDLLPALPFLLLALGACPKTSTDGGTASARRLAGSARGWNLLLVSIDTLRADRLGIYGYRVRDTSPNIDSLVRRGVRFADAQSQRAATWPSLATALTGLYPSSHGVVENGYGFPDGLPTLPLVLAGSGYETGAFLSNMCKANHQGWSAFGCSGGEDGKTVRRALDWARDRPRDKPYLLWVHLFGAHSPYYNGGDLAERLDPGYSGPVGGKKWQLERIHRERVALGERDVQHLDALYDAAVVGSDRHLGTLIDGLRTAGALDRTVIVFFSDHGEELYRHNRYLYHSCSVYQTTLHVPLAITAPGLVAQGATVPQQVELVDLAPTLLDLLGVTPPEMQGRSLVPYLERPGGGGAGKPAYSEYGLGPIRTVADGGRKLIWNPQGYDPVCIPGMPRGHYPIGRAELYDLESDPGETNNLADRDPATVRRLAGLIERRFSSLPKRAQPQALTEEQRKQLQALGYAVP